MVRFLFGVTLSFDFEIIVVEQRIHGVFCLLYLLLTFLVYR